ncbi:MAG: oxidoreductase [Hyphobacterium sp.]|nr:MAG: oxidoreductase [Hyphobacterium sp.]
MKRLAIIGPGKVGRTLARLFHDAGVFEIRALVSRSAETAAEAAAFIGAGQVNGDPADADIILMAVPDPELAQALARLALCDLKPGTIIAHTSGALGPEVFAPLAGLPVRCACAHPVKAFSDPARSVGTFAGTMTTLQGVTPACDELREAFAAIGGKTLVLADDTDRTLYHAAIVFMANHLPTLVQAGLETFEQVGLSREDGLAISGPILRDTLEAVLERGPAAALTGPVARGDAETVSRHLESLNAIDGDLGALYAALARATADLSAEKGEASVEGLLAIRELTTPKT